MLTSLVGVPSEVIENAKRRCDELNRDLVSVGKNNDNYVVLAKKRKNEYKNYGMGWFDVWTGCDEKGSFNWGTYDLSEEKANEIFYTGNKYLRLEVVNVEDSVSYDRLKEIAKLGLERLEMVDENTINLTETETEELDIRL